eukprot:273308_1
MLAPAITLSVLLLSYQLIKTTIAYQGVPVLACGVSGNWDYAQSYCQSHGCYGLASIAEGQNENVRAECGSTDCWVGLQCVSDTWQWSDGSSYSWTNWASGRPNACECGKIETSSYVSAGQWVNDGCIYDKTFVCDCPSYNDVACTPQPTTPKPTTPKPTTPKPTTSEATTPEPTTPEPTTSEPTTSEANPTTPATTD